ncbi:hypothetical protein D3C80_975080 [compost metagenome]
MLGDPHYFAIQIDVVVSWNIPDDIWKNGLFYLYIDGKRVFDNLDGVELATTVGFYRNAPIDQLPVSDIDMDVVSLYRNAEAYFTGDSEQLVEGLFDLTCTGMGDAGCYLYYIRTRSGDRLVWSSDNGVTVREITLEAGAVSKVVEGLRMFVL